MVSGLISSTVPMMTGILSRRVTARRVATTRWTGRGMKQTTRPTPNAPVTPRRQSPQRRGSAILAPKRRRNQRLSREPGDGQMRFKSLRGMVFADCIRNFSWAAPNYLTGIAQSRDPVHIASECAEYRYQPGVAHERHLLGDVSP